jgi:hypothetical protein
MGQKNPEGCCPSEQRHFDRLSAQDTGGLLVDHWRLADLQLEYAAECGRYLQQNRIVVVEQSAPRIPVELTKSFVLSPALDGATADPETDGQRLQPAHCATTVG